MNESTELKRFKKNMASYNLIAGIVIASMVAYLASTMPTNNQHLLPDSNGTNNGSYNIHPPSFSRTI